MSQEIALVAVGALEVVVEGALGQSDPGGDPIDPEAGGSLGGEHSETLFEPAVPSGAHRGTIPIRMVSSTATDPTARRAG